MVWLFTIANVGQHHSLKKIFLGFYKNFFHFIPIIFPDTPKSFGQKDFKPDSISNFLSGTESGFVCLILSYNHRQRKSRNLSYTNQFNSRRSLTSTKKQTKNNKEYFFSNFGKKVKKEAECPRNQINSLEKNLNTHKNKREQFENNN